MKVSIVGCGNIANTHASALCQQKQDIIAVVDENLELAVAFKEKWGAKYASAKFEDALIDGVDCVHICTPPTLHYSMVKQAILANKHIVCEKPLCLTSAEAKELMELAANRKLLTAVNFNVRYHEACKRAKEMISHDDFGDIHLIHGSYLQEFHILPAMYMWRYVPELAGKMRAVTEIGSHWVDLVRYWTGLEIKEVSANFGKFNPRRVISEGTMFPPNQQGEAINVDSEDAAIVSLRFSNGAIGSMLLSEVSHGRSNSVNLEVSGGKRSVWWSSENPYSLNHAEKFSGVTSQVNAFGGGFPDTFSSFFEKLYTALESGNYLENPDFPTFYDGYVNAAVCEAIYDSANNNSIWMEVK